VTGPGHWEEAELLLNESSCEYGCPHSGCPHEMRLIARAQVHATLAIAAAVACGRLGEMPARDADAWQDLTGTQAASPYPGTCPNCGVLPADRHTPKCGARDSGQQIWPGTQGGQP